MNKKYNELFLKWRNPHKSDQYIDIQQVFVDYINLDDTPCNPDDYVEAIDYINTITSFQKIYSTQVCAVIMANALRIAEGKAI